MTTIEEFNVEEYCGRTLEFCKRLANVDMDYTVESLARLEPIIQQNRVLKANNIIDDNTAWQLAINFGSYYGEVMLRDSLAANGYAWQLDESGIPVLSDAKGINAIRPITKVYKKIISENENDGEGTLEDNYKIFQILVSQ